MVNIEEFIKRLELILDYYSLSASAFADKINVQRSSLSHLLSGRNKPSLDFILKINEEFPEVDLNWILKGEGHFPKDENTPTPTIAPEIPKRIESKEEDLFSTEIEVPKVQSQNENIEQPSFPENKNEIDRIVIFFKNGTFKNYIG